MEVDFEHSDSEEIDTSVIDFHLISEQIEQVQNIPYFTVL